MKTKLAMIAVIMAIGVWLAVGDSPRVRSMEQRVAELEQVVAQLNQVVASQQEQITRFLPLADEMEITDNGQKVLVIHSSVVVSGSFLQADNWLTVGSSFSVLGNIYYKGDIIKY